MKRLLKYSKGTSKYKNQQVYFNGLKFDSKKEAGRYQELLMLQKAGKICQLKTQVPFVLIDKSRYGRAIKYIADFTYLDDQLNYIVEDTKGFRTDVYKLKKRLFIERYGLEIKEL